MTTNNELKKPSYNGVEFFYRSATETGGFKVAEHLYPDSNNFRVEQMGGVARKFRIECGVKFENRDSFDIALNTPGTGVLSHPMYGNFLVKVTTYEKRDGIDALGFYVYSVEFVVEIGLIAPSIEDISSNVINTAKSVVLTNVTNMVTDNFRI